MVRVIPITTNREILKDKGTSSSNLGGDEYFYASKVTRSNIDPRAKSSEQDKLMNNFGTAANIYHQKPGCWQDHFKRSEKIVHYNLGYIGSKTHPGIKRKSGYNLAMQMLTDTLKKGDGNYYNPECFCIQPLDHLGEVSNVYAQLNIDYSRPVKYFYLEEILPVEYKGSADPIYETFKSAVSPGNIVYDTCDLLSEYCFCRDNTLPRSQVDISTVQKIPMWPAFKLRFERGGGWYNIYSWQTDKLVYQKVPRDELPSESPQMRGYEIRPGSYYWQNDLCCRSHFYIRWHQAPGHFSGYINHTGVAPYVYVDLGDQFLGRFGVGCGGSVRYPLQPDYSGLERQQNHLMEWNAAVNPAPYGYQPHNYPTGKLSEARLVGISYGPPNSSCTHYRWIDQFWQTDDPIHFDNDRRTPIVKANVWGFGCHYGGFQEWMPCGGLKIFAIGPGGQEMALMQSGGFINMNEGQREYCYTHWRQSPGSVGDYSLFRTRIQTGPITWSSCYTHTFLGDGTCLPDTGPCNDAIPFANQRGLFFLEKTKPFKMRDPCCRCPEEKPPKCCKQPPCPKEGLFSKKKKIWTECKVCQGASPYGFVYDNLI